MYVRKALYWLTWPLEILVDFVTWSCRGLKFIIIASNPAFLAFYLMDREKRSTMRKGVSQRH